MVITLKAARVNSDLTLTQAAKILRIHKNTLSSYENYKTKPDIELSKKMADLYGCTVNDLIFFKQ